MQRLAHFDVSRQFVTRRAKIVSQLVFGGFCAVAMIGLRSLVDIWAPASGPFALVYPTVLLATLYGHWRAGLVALVGSFLWAWYFVLPVFNSFEFSAQADIARVPINAVCSFVLLVLAEAFRRAAHRTVEQSIEAAERRKLLLADLEHRTKNNFALVASLLELQKRSINKPEFDGPIDDAVGRVRSFAESYSQMTLDENTGAEVAMVPYLDQLMVRVRRAFLPENVGLHSEIDALVLPRQVALAIGLYINEAICNCAKYAFPDDRPGTVAVSLFEYHGGWRLMIEDDGVGIDSQASDSSRLGSDLLAAFAKQAGGHHAAGPTLRGYSCELRCETIEVA